MDKKVIESVVPKMTDDEYKSALKDFQDFDDKCFADLKEARDTLGNNDPKIDKLAAIAAKSRRDLVSIKEARA